MIKNLNMQLSMYSGSGVLQLAFRWSCPNPYISKIIPLSGRCGTICSTQILTIPLNKESPCNLNFLHNGRSNSQSRSNYLLHGVDIPYVKYRLRSVTPLHRVDGGIPITKEHYYQISREPNYFKGVHYYTFLRQTRG